MLLDPDRVREAVSSLATFHAIGAAYRATEPVPLENRFPLLDAEKGACAWFQDDMTDFLQEMYATCHNFLEV